MKVCLAALMFLTGCTTFTGKTAQGWNWSSLSDSVSSDKIEVITNITREVFEEYTGRKVPESAFNYIDKIHFTYFPTYCPPENPFGSGKCNGQIDYEDKEMWITSKGYCLATTSLSHELIHMFAKATHINSFHDNPMLFKRARGADKDTVEYKAKKKSFQAIGCTEIVLF